MKEVTTTDHSPIVFAKNGGGIRQQPRCGGLHEPDVHWTSKFFIVVNVFLGWLLVGYMVSRHIGYGGDIKGADLVTILLTALAVMLAILTIFLASLAVWGYASIREASDRIAKDVASEVAKKTATEVRLVLQKRYSPNRVAKQAVMNMRTQLAERTDSYLTPVEVISAHQKTAPVDVHAIAHALGIEVAVDRLLPDDISGKIEAIGSSGKYRATVNGKHSETRQRFTIAHEIAHYVLHRSLIGDGIVDDAMYRSKQGSEIERQANSYAATILMPAPLVREMYRAGVKSYPKMAALFDVSPEVARIRMKELFR